MKIIFVELLSIASTSSSIINNTIINNKSSASSLSNNENFEFNNINISNNNLRIKKSQQNFNSRKALKYRNKMMMLLNSLMPGFILLTSFFSLIYGKTSETKINAFIAEPNVEPYYVKERDIGPLIRCVIAKEFKNRSRYELEWMKIVSGLPMYF